MSVCQCITTHTCISSWQDSRVHSPHPPSLSLSLCPGSCLDHVTRPSVPPITPPPLMNVYDAAIVIHGVCTTSQVCVFSFLFPPSASRHGEVIEDFGNVKDERRVILRQTIWRSTSYLPGDVMVTLNVLAIFLQNLDSFFFNHCIIVCLLFHSPKIPSGGGCSFWLM